MSPCSPAVVPTSFDLSSPKFLVGRLSFASQSSSSINSGSSSRSVPTIFSGETVLRVQTFRKNCHCDILFRVENKLGPSQPVFAWLRAYGPWKASHLAKFSLKVPHWLEFADVEKRCLLPYTSTAATRLPIYDRSVHFQRECWEMLQQRTRVHFAQRGRSVSLAHHHFGLWPSTCLVCLVLRNTHAASSPPASDPDKKRNLQLQPRVPRIFCSHPTLPSQDSSPSCFSLTFGRPSSQSFSQDTSPSYSSLTFGQPAS